jgi:hypothetical protein
MAAYNGHPYYAPGPNFYSFPPYAPSGSYPQAQAHTWGAAPSAGQTPMPRRKNLRRSSVHEDSSHAPSMPVPQAPSKSRTQGHRSKPLKGIMKKPPTMPIPVIPTRPLSESRHDLSSRPSSRQNINGVPGRCHLCPLCPFYNLDQSIFSFPFTAPTNTALKMYTIQKTRFMVTPIPLL